MVVVFWAALLLLGWIYAGYPLVALVAGRLWPVRLASAEGSVRLVTVGIAVHNGAGTIAERIADVFVQEVPFEVELIVASDGSTDGTPRIVEELARDDARVRLLELPRGGQSIAQSAIFETARGELVVLTDVDTRYAGQCLERLVGPFADERVGCVTGVLRWRHEQRSPTAHHEGLYWRYEQRVRAWEGRAGWLAAATGALLCARRDLYRPVPAHASLDQMLPLIARENGRLVVAAGQAIGWDQGVMGLRDQVRSRIRIATQGIEANLRMLVRIHPWRQPGTFLAIWSHKILRWATPFLAVAAVIAGLIAFLGGGAPVYIVPAGVALVVSLLAALGLAARRTGKRVPLTGFPMTIVAVNLAFALGWWNVVRRRRATTWDPQPLSD